jgi:hypothetical protein
MFGGGGLDARVEELEGEIGIERGEFERGD